MTTTINTIDDFARILRENPDWVDTLRALLLSKELLELPERFAEFAAATNARLDRLESDVAELKEGQARLESDVAELKESQARTQADVAELKTGQETIMQSQRRIQDDIGYIRGRFTSVATQEEVRGIVAEMGFTYRHTLTKSEIMDLSLSQDTRDIPRPDLRSFRRADFIIEVADADGAINYIAIEASYTLTDYDRQRAVRNAGLMTRFTGQPSHPALTGVRIDNELADAIANGEILWYEIDEAILAAE